MRPWPSAIAVALLASMGSLTAVAGDDLALAALEKVLPKGWTVIATDTELVIRHDRACYVAAEAHDASGPLVTLELRYHLQPKWGAKQLADAKLANDRVAGQLVSLRKQFKMDLAPPAKPSADDTKRVAAFSKAEAELAKQKVRTPLCTLGESSLFDGDDTYAQLKLKVDPPQAMQKAKDIVELVKKQCGAG